LSQFFLGSIDDFRSDGLKTDIPGLPRATDNSTADLCSHKNEREAFLILFNRAVPRVAAGDVGKLARAVGA
jgi:hypothetical protein